MPENEISLERIVASPFLLVLGAVVVLILLIVPIVWLAMHHLLTAIALTGFFTVVFWALVQAKILNPEKQRWVSPVVVVTLIATFLFGFYGERTGSFYITPLTETPTGIPPMLANVPPWISASLTAILVLALLVAVTIGLTVRRP